MFGKKRSSVSMVRGVCNNSNGFFLYFKYFFQVLACGTADNEWTVKKMGVN